MLVVKDNGMRIQNITGLPHAMITAYSRVGVGSPFTTSQVSLTWCTESEIKTALT